MFVGSGQVLWTFGIAGVNKVSPGSFHCSKTRAREAKWFHDKLKGYVFDLERDGLRQAVPCP